MAKRKNKKNFKIVDLKKRTAKNILRNWSRG